MLLQHHGLGWCQAAVDVRQKPEIADYFAALWTEREIFMRRYYDDHHEDDGNDDGAVDNNTTARGGGREGGDNSSGGGGGKLKKKSKKVAEEAATTMEQRKVTREDPIKATEMYSSCDGVSVYLKDGNEPGMGGYHREGYEWLHYDRAPNDRHMWSVQGFVNLLPTERGSNGAAAFQCLVRSHRHQQAFAERFAGAVDRDARFRTLQSQREVDFFMHECDAQPLVCVRADVGDLVLWDSRLVHSGRAATPSAVSRGRTVVYVAMQPKWLATERDVKRKVLAFKTLRTTSHNAAAGVKLFGRLPQPFGRRMVLRNKASHPISRPPTLTSLGMSLFGIDGASYLQAHEAYKHWEAQEAFLAAEQQ
jgi:hypothetical protein